MKLHLCCSSVYLTGYINIDIQGILIENYPYQINETTLDNYHKGPLRSPPLSRRGHFVIDMKLDLLTLWPFENESVDEIVMIEGIEHFLPDEGEFIISEVYRTLKPGGIFKFDFPDIIKSVEKYIGNFNVLNRLIYCNHKDPYSIHKIAYNEYTFGVLLFNNDRKWKSLRYKQIVEHVFPVIGGEVIK